MALTANLRASLLMAAAMAGFTINDALVKSLGGTINPGQVMMVRGVIMAIFLAAWFRIRGTGFPLSRAWSLPMALRILGEVMGTMLFLNALFHMPIANVSAVLQALPLAVTLGAALFLGESVGIRRLSAILIGFFGVLVIVRPGLAGFNAFSLSALGTVFFAAMRDLATRRLPADIPTLAVSLLTTCGVTIAGGILMIPFGGWQPVSPNALAVLAGAAAFLFVGYQCIVIAMRTGEDIHVVAPFRYTSLLWAILLGLVFYGEIPDALTVAGAAIVIATGLYALYRERVSGKRATALMSAASAPPARGT